MTREADDEARWHLYDHLDLLDRHLVDVAAGRIRRLMIELPPRHGKALALDTPIPTPDGWKVMGDLRPGDRVYGRDGRPCDVVAVSPIWRDRPVYRVRTDDGDEIVADAEHEWEARLCGKRPVFRLHTTETLGRKRKKRAMIQATAPLHSWACRLPVDPWVLGFWLGDGTAAHATLTVGHEDWDAVRAEVRAAGYSITERATLSTFGVGGLQRHLRGLGVLGNKHVPQVYLRASEAQRLALLQGLVDSDGYVATDGQVEFSSTSRRLAENVRELVWSLGVKAGWSEGRATIDGRDCGPKYRVMFYMAEAARLHRKRERCRNGARTTGRYVTAEPAGTADTVCIQVNSPDHMFLAGRSMLPTHNSELASKYLPAWYVGMFPHRRVLLASYEADFAAEWGRAARDILEEWGPTVFGVQVSAASSAANRWDLYRKRGGMKTAGVGGPITGKGGHLVIIDDPIKNDAEAYSETHREAIWRWYQFTLRTRLEPNAAIILIMCMTGDTPVLRPDGSETPLRDIRPGDEVVSHGDGGPTTSRVVNWANQGPDRVYEVRMKSGRKVRANARHPFRVIDENGDAKWVRLESLRAGMKVRSVEARTGASSALSTAASRPQNAWSVGADEIVEIVDAGVEDVFDIEVERTHNFIANGLEVSNTRWHEDDLAGRIRRLEESNPDADKWVRLTLPAFAEQDDPLGRPLGAPLCPERYDKDELLAEKASVGPLAWEALFQQRPTLPEGEMFKLHWWNYVDAVPYDVRRWVRRWDLAATEAKPGKDPDWTAGVLMGRHSDGRIFVKDARRIRGTPLEVERFMASTAEEDGREVPVRVAQDPGQAGKSQVSHLSRLVLPQADFSASRESGDKTTRARPYASQAQAGNVFLLRGHWNADYVEEHRTFPHGTHDDFVDASAMGYDDLFEQHDEAGRYKHVGLRGRR